MSVSYQSPQFQIDEESRSITAKFRIVNHSNKTWQRDGGYSLGWQIFDPETGTFIAEGDWHPFRKDLAPEDTAELRAVLVEEFGRIHGKPELLSAFIRHAGVPVRLQC